MEGGGGHRLGLGWLTKPVHPVTEVVETKFREAAGSSEAVPFELVLPSRRSGWTSRGRLRDAEEALEGLLPHALATVSQANYRSLWTRYETFCWACTLEEDSLRSVALFMADLIVANKIKSASSIDTYSKIFSAVFSRLGLTSRPRRTGIVTDLHSAFVRMTGQRPQDLFECPTWEEILDLAAALTTTGYPAISIFVRVAWLTAARVANLLTVRLCDISGDHDLLFLTFPANKTDTLRLGQSNVIGEQGLMSELLALISHRVMAEHGRLWTRLWTCTRASVLAAVRAADAGVTTSRAYRRGFITSALLAGCIRPDTAIVSHHLTMAMVGRYSAFMPAAEAVTQQRVVTSAMAVRRGATPGQRLSGM